jgi:tetratricopeptide (TPR) repeat protein
VALLAAAIAFRPSATAAAPRPHLNWLPVAAGVLLVFFHIAAVTLPTMRTEFWLHQLKRAAFHEETPFGMLAVLEQQVLTSDPLDADAAREVAGVATLIGSRPSDQPQERVERLKQAEHVAQLALERNPQSRAAHVRLGSLYQEMEEAYLLAVRPDEASAALRHAAQHWQKAVELYPTDPRTRISAAKVWVELWEDSDDPVAAQTAAEHFNAALAIDAARPVGEVMRLRPEEREEIERYMRELPR